MELDTTNLEPVFADVMDDNIGLIRAEAVRLAVQLHLADLLKDGPRSITQLAEATQTKEDSLYRLLYALACCGYFEEVTLRVFAQTRKSHVLRTDIPRSLASFILMSGEVWQWEPWREALKSIQTGEPVFPEMFGKTLWRYFVEDNPAAGERFHQAMSSQSKQYNLDIVHAYDFSGVRTLMDIAGGQGSFLETILHAYPDIHGILFDQPPVIETARLQPFVTELSDRVKLEAGNFFEMIPPGADIYVLKQIIHNWDDAEAIQILSNCRKALKEHGRILVIDEIVTPGTKLPPMIALVDLQLHLLMAGRKRSEDEHRVLFDAAGLQLNRVLPAGSTYTIIEAVAP